MPCWQSRSSAVLSKARIPCESNSTSPLRRLWSVEMQCPTELGCSILEFCFPWMICRESSEDWARILECKRKQSLYLSPVVVMALLHSYGFLIWDLGSSLLVISREENPIHASGSVSWWFLLFSIIIGRVGSDWVQLMLTKIRPVHTASQLGWKVKPGKKWEFGSSGEYLQHLAIQRA